MAHAQRTDKLMVYASGEQLPVPLLGELIVELAEVFAE